MSVQRGDLVAGRYRLGDPLGPAWRAHDEHDDVEVVLVPQADGTPDPAPWRDRKAILAPAGSATGDHGAWLVTAPVPARTLADAVAQWGALPAEQVLAIAAGAVTAVSGVGPHPAMTPDHILLTDDGKVLLLPVRTPEDALFELGAALFLAAEGHSPFDPAPGNPRQPQLAPLIRGLMQKDPDQAAALDRAHAELSRLGAPVDTEHGADTLVEAQVASAAAAEDEPTHIAEARDIPTQPMSVQELLAETGESAAVGDAVGDAETEAEADDGSATNESTQAMSAEELLAESDDELPVVAADDEEPTQVAPTIALAAAAGFDAAGSGSGSEDEPTDSPPSAPDAEATRQVPALAPADEPPPTRPEPIPEVTAAVAPPTQAAAYVAPPTQAAAPVPPPQFQPTPQPQPQFQAPPQQFSAAPPTQAAAAYPPAPPGAPNPGAPNPWLQQQPPQPQNPWQNPGTPPGAPGGPPGPPGGGWGQPGQQPFYPMPGPPPQKNTGKTVAIIIGAVAAVAVVVLVVVLVSKGGGSKDKVDNAAHTSGHTTSQTSSVPSTNFPTPSSSSSSSPSPSDSSSSDTESPSDSTSSSSDAYTPPPDLTSTPFDPSVLNEGATDKTPLTLEALTPQDFTDDKGVHYALKAGSIQPCVQSDMSANMKDILTSNSCTKEIAASYVDDSGQYLVSVKVLPLPDQHTATVIYNDMAKENAADFGIWCPKDGPGSGACDGDYRSATIKQYREQQHRYVILSVALAVNHSESSTITPWLDAAAKKAVDVAGPDNWSGNQ